MYTHSPYIVAVIYMYIYMNHVHTENECVVTNSGQRTGHEYSATSSRVTAFAAGFYAAERAATLHDFHGA